MLRQDVTRTTLLPEQQDLEMLKQLDIDGSGEIDRNDAFYLTSAFGSTKKEDLELFDWTDGSQIFGRRDGKIDLQDFFFLSLHFGKRVGEFKPPRELQRGEYLLRPSGDFRSGEYSGAVYFYGYSIQLERIFSDGKILLHLNNGEEEKGLVLLPRQTEKVQDISITLRDSFYSSDKSKSYVILFLDVEPRPSLSKNADVLLIQTFPQERYFFLKKGSKAEIEGTEVVFQEYSSEEQEGTLIIDGKTYSGLTFQDEIETSAFRLKIQGFSPDEVILNLFQKNPSNES